jgi:hypothetical protein
MCDDTPMASPPEPHPSPAPDRWRSSAIIRRRSGLIVVAGEVAAQAQEGIQRVCASDSLVLGFVAHTGLALDDHTSP